MRVTSVSQHRARGDTRPRPAAGTIDVSGGAGTPGQERASGGGGGAGGGFVKLSCPQDMLVSGRIAADGGAPTGYNSAG
jgi:hypothetical protein